MDTFQHNEQLFDSFVFDIHDALATFESAAEELGHDYNIDSLKELGVLAHRIRGTAALYNYPQLSRLAEIIERLMEHGERIPEGNFPLLLDFLERAMVCFRSSLETITETGREGEIGLQLSALGGTDIFKTILRAAPEAFVRERDIIAQKGYVQSANIVSDLRTFFRANGDSWEFFAPEASEHLDIITTTLEKAQPSSDDITQLFRSTHTLKGAAYMIDFKPMGDLAHRLEDLMVLVREGGKAFDDGVRSALAEGTHVLRAMLATAEGEDTDLVEYLEGVNTQLSKALGQTPVEPAPAQSEIDTLVQTLQTFKGENVEVWEYFAPEVQDNLSEMARSLEKARQGDQDEETITTIFRAGHTIKGAAYTVNFNALGDLAKDVESISRALRETNDFQYQEVADAMQAGHFALSEMMKAANGETHELENSLKTFRELYTPLNLSDDIVVATPAQEVKQRRSAESRTSTIRVSLEKIDTLMNLAGEIVISRARLDSQLGRFNEIGSVLEASRRRMVRTTAEFEEKYLNPRLREMSQAMTAQGSSEGRSGLKNSINEMFDELEFDTYSDLNILARTVSEMTNDLSEVQGQLERFTRGLSQEVEQVQRLSRSLRNEVSRTRLVPISQLYNRLRRLVKQSDMNKFYTLETSGEGVELDAAILEDITDPMLHLVKNAIAHGIEPREERMAKAKDEAGTITLRAYPQGNYIFVEVQDDGAGIDVEAVKAKALEKGLRSQAEISRLSDEEAINLIFLPGLSTAKEVTTDAGRGVGMDAVATNIRKLGGEISIATNLGRGTRFTLRLPLTLLVSEAMMVKSGGQTFAFPINTVKTLRYLAADQLTGSEVNIGEQLLPLYHLHELLHLPMRAQGFERAVAVLETGSGQVALSVDDFAQIEEVVIKSLGETLQKLSYLSGATISSRGEVILLLDPASLIGLAGQGIRQAVAYTPAATTQAATQTLRLLLVDDSVSVRKVVGKMLVRAGYDVTTANDGQDALEVLRQNTFDVILTDLEMPRLNGYELIEDIRRRFDAKILPVVVMTTRAGEKHMNLAFELGANNYLTKPVDENKLLNFLRTLKSKDASLANR